MNTRFKSIIKELIPDYILKIKNERYVMSYLKNDLKYCSPKSNQTMMDEISELYSQYFGRNIDWDNPKTYTEKINVRKVFGNTKLITQLTDKLAVRDWVKQTIGEEYLIPLIASYDSIDELDYSQLPKRFVIKCNHDSGSVTIVSNKHVLNKKRIKTKYELFMKRNYGWLKNERNYVDITPKILVEKYMGKSIKDYKFLCFDGEPKYCWVDFDRFSNHKRNFYDCDWKLQRFNQSHYPNTQKDVPKPKDFDKMLSIAKVLSKGFDHVRVDLYYIDDRIYFGEMTFTNGSGFDKIYPDEYDYIIGSLWNLKAKRNND